MNKSEEEFNLHIANLKMFQKKYKKEIEDVQDAYIKYLIEFIDLLDKGLKQKDIDEIEAEYFCMNISEQNLTDVFNMITHITKLSMMHNLIMKKIKKRNKNKGE